MSKQMLFGDNQENQSQMIENIRSYLRSTNQ